MNCETHINNRHILLPIQWVYSSDWMAPRIHVTGAAKTRGWPSAHWCHLGWLLDGENWWYVWGFMVILWWFHGDFMGFHGDFMHLNRNTWWFNSHWMVLSWGWTIKNLEYRFSGNTTGLDHLWGEDGFEMRMFWFRNVHIHMSGSSRAGNDFQGGQEPWADEGFGLGSLMAKAATVERDLFRGGPTPRRSCQKSGVEKSRSLSGQPGHHGRV